MAPRRLAGGWLDSLGITASAHVAPRRVDVWLPPGYARQVAPSAVIYAHDGQNLFDAHEAYSGVDWGIAPTAARLMAEGAIGSVIIVGIWNTPARIGEYLPRRPLLSADGAALRASAMLNAGAIRSDAYLRFIVDELKPLIDARYRTSADPAATMVLGASMGGLISLYGALEYPAIFGAAACLSPHWSLAGPWFVDALAERLPAPGRLRIYHDRGTLGIDAGYAAGQQRFDAALLQRGYQPGRDTWSYVAEGADHHEAAWRERVATPLRVLFGAVPDDHSARRSPALRATWE
jgi:predicted alpha/beta superfamily hydrolase